MLKYKIPIYTSPDNKNNSAILDFTLAIIKMPKPHDTCLFALNKFSDSKNITITSAGLREVFIIFPERNLEYFSSLLSKYNAAAIDNLPPFDTVNVLYGDGTVVSQCEEQ